MWIPNGINLLIISIYATQELSEKRTLWDYLCFTICNWDGDVVTMGDFNEVRDSIERYGSVFNKHGAKLFNDFIAKAGLTEVPLGGCIFTWCHKTESKMSKLDRFLVFDSLLCNCPRISSMTLDRYLSDHRPNLLRESIYDYGPIHFKFYHYWFEIDGFDKLVEDSWNEIHAVDLEREVSKEEVKRAVWDCGIDKAPGLDGFTFGFYRHFWNLIECDAIKAVKWFFFMKESRVKVGFIDTILKKFGLGDKWCKWIHSCLQSSRGQWNQSNIDTIIRVLKVFHSASGLCINMKKSKLIGITVDASKVKQAIRQIG
nr:RNA-directed DNA polymerase, eukaryota [Tanacetum cinerariifolium]